MTWPAAQRGVRRTILRVADARRAAQAAVSQGCEVEVTTPDGLRFRFRPFKAEAEPEGNPWDDAHA